MMGRKVGNPSRWQPKYHWHILEWMHGTLHTSHDCSALANQCGTYELGPSCTSGMSAPLWCSFRPPPTQCGLVGSCHPSSCTLQCAPSIPGHGGTGTLTSELKECRHGPPCLRSEVMTRLNYHLMITCLILFADQVTLQWTARDRAGNVAIAAVVVTVVSSSSPVCALSFGGVRLSYSMVNSMCRRVDLQITVNSTGE